VKVAVDKEDRRSRLLTITPAGRVLLNKAFPIWKKTHAGVERELADLTPDKLRAALRVLS
jgi:DNA-binding MarR family transcriptional regulator